MPALPFTSAAGKKLIPSAQVGVARTLARAGDIAGARAAYELFEPTTMKLCRSAASWNRCTGSSPLALASNA